MKIIIFLIAIAFFSIIIIENQKNLSIKNIDEVEMKKQKNKLSSEIKKRNNIIPYDKYEAYLEAINPDTLDISSVKERSLTNTEKQFLKYMSYNKTVQHLDIARYWYYTYGIDVKEEICLFLKLNLLEVKKGLYLEKHTIPELKKFLELKSAPKTGKKADLIKRIYEYFTLDEIIDFFKEVSYYSLTEEGEKIVNSLPSSTSINSDMETECINLILKEKYEEAYDRVCDFRNSSPTLSGLNFDWKATKKEGWNKRHLDKTSEKNKVYSACLIYCDMMGISYKNAATFYKDITNEKYNLTEKEVHNFSVEQYLFYSSNKKELDNYIKRGIKKYKILSSCDRSTCKKCAHMDGKEFNVLDAVIGDNAPPFEYDCRCTTIAAIEESNNFEKNRRVKDEKGKSILVPYMNYKEWSKKYAPDKYKEYFE